MADKFKACSVIGCNNDTPYPNGFSRGLCRSHYGRFMRHGDPLAGRIDNGERLRYLEEVVLPYKGLDCLTWPYSRDIHGYPKAKINGKQTQLTRYICEALNGPPLVPSLHAAHSCGNGHLGCVNPNHLSWKTPKENNADKVAHGTDIRGEKNVGAKLTESQVLEIRSLKGIHSLSFIAGKYGISKGSVSAILSGKRWASVTTPLREESKSPTTLIT